MRAGDGFSPVPLSPAPARAPRGWPPAPPPAPRPGTPGGAELADHDPGGEVGERPPLPGGGAPARQGQGQRRDDGVSGAGDVEHLARGGGHVQRGAALLEQAHAVLAARDEHGPAAQRARGSGVRPPTSAGPRSRRPVACSASSWFGVTTVAPRYRRKWRTFGSTSTGMPRRPARGRTRFSSAG